VVLHQVLKDGEYNHKQHIKHIQMMKLLDFIFKQMTSLIHINHTLRWLSSLILKIIYNTIFLIHLKWILDQHSILMDHQHHYLKKWCYTQIIRKLKGCKNMIKLEICCQILVWNLTVELSNNLKDILMNNQWIIIHLV
jgi:hypothetical protein